MMMYFVKLWCYFLFYWRYDDDFFCFIGYMMTNFTIILLNYDDEFCLMVVRVDEEKRYGKSI